MNFISTVIIELLGGNSAFSKYVLGYDFIIKGTSVQIGVASREKAFLELH